jgi:hypothetical protein
MRVTILMTFYAAPDHLHTRRYYQGEEYEVGSALMPQGLVDSIQNNGVWGWASGYWSDYFIKVDDKPISGEMRAQHAEMHHETFSDGQRNVPQPLPW